MPGIVYDERKITDYDVVTHTTLATMVTNVKHKIKDGGNIYGPFGTDGTNFRQAGVKIRKRSAKIGAS